jgi:hypothetical protein
MNIPFGVSHCAVESEDGLRPCPTCGMNCYELLNNKEKALGSHKPKTS